MEKQNKTTELIVNGGKVIIQVFSTMVLIVMTPTFNKIANTTREIPGYGGECLVWLLPLFARVLYTMCKSIKEDFDNFF